MVLFSQTQFSPKIAFTDPARSRDVRPRNRVAIPVDKNLPEQHAMLAEAGDFDEPRQDISMPHQNTVMMEVIDAVIELEEVMIQTACVAVEDGHSAFEILVACLQGCESGGVVL